MEGKNVLSYSAKECVLNALQEKGAEIIGEIIKNQEILAAQIRQPPEKTGSEIASSFVEPETGIIEERIENLKKCLKKVYVSIIRLAKDEYGYCVICGEPIPLARLEKVIFADKCVECKERLSSQKQKRA
jgi:RNA polymerase-binding transcription factor DksA